MIPSATPCFVIANNKFLVNFVFKSKTLAKEYAYEKFGQISNWVLVEREDLVKYVQKENLKLTLVDKVDLAPIPTEKVYKKEYKSKLLDRKFSAIHGFYLKNKPFLINYLQWEKIML